MTYLGVSNCMIWDYGRSLVVVLLIMMGPMLLAQESSSDSLTYISMKAQEAMYENIEGEEVDTLIGNVELIQDSLFMYCDRAIVRNQLYASATSNIVIIHNDSIHIFADSLYYDGSAKIAELYGEVILQDGERRVFTHELTYYVNDKTAVYTEGGTLMDGLDKKLVSKYAKYQSATKESLFKENVRFEDSTMVMETDSLIYLLDIEEIQLISPTRIEQDSVNIYAEAGIHRSKTKQTILSNNVQIAVDKKVIYAGLAEIDGQEKKYVFTIEPRIVDSVSVASGDSIFYFEEIEILEIRSNASYLSEDDELYAPVIVYNRETDTYSTLGRSTALQEDAILEADALAKMESGSSLASGNVIYADTSKGVNILSAFALLPNQGNKFKAYSDTGYSYMSYALSTDSLYVAADTLTSKESDGSDTLGSFFEAFYDVKLMKSNTFGICDSLCYIESDSVLSMIGAPILWSQNTQMTADTIYLRLENNTVNLIELKGNAFIVDQDSLGQFNQIKGNSMINYLKDGEIQSTFVQGNAQLTYFVREGDNYEAINSTKCSEMRFTFASQNMDTARFYGRPQSVMTEFPADGVVSGFNLEGFQWMIDKKPTKKDFGVILSSLP